MLNFLRDGKFQVVFHVDKTLARQTVHQINADVIEKLFRRVNRSQRRIFIVNPAQNPQQLIVKSLHAQTYSVKTQPAQIAQIIFVDRAWISLNRNFRGVVKTNRAENFFKLADFQKAGRAAAEINRAESFACRANFNFLRQRVDVSRNFVRAASFGIERAVVAFARAERNVDVNHLAPSSTRSKSYSL